jgi:hypothetical protein
MCCETDLNVLCLWLLFMLMLQFADAVDVGRSCCVLMLC